MRLIPFLQSLSTDRSPRVHANGFIQLDVTPQVRLHVWGDARIPHQDPPLPIHNHAFSFISRVLIGALHQTTYRVVETQPEADFAPEQQFYVPHVARIDRGENTVLEPYAGQITAVSDGAVIISTDYGDALATYAMKRGDFHESEPLRRTVSVIIKDDPSLMQGGGKPTVLVPLGVTPSTSFSRHDALSFGDMWQIIGDVVLEDPEAVAAGLAWALFEAQQVRRS